MLLRHGETYLRYVRSGEQGGGARSTWAERDLHSWVERGDVDGDL